MTVNSSACSSCLQCLKHEGPCIPVYLISVRELYIIIHNLKPSKTIHRSTWADLQLLPVPYCLVLLLLLL